MDICQSPGSVSTEVVSNEPGRHGRYRHQLRPVSHRRRTRGVVPLESEEEKASGSRPENFVERVEWVSHAGFGPGGAVVGRRPTVGSLGLGTNFRDWEFEAIVRNFQCGRSR